MENDTICTLIQDMLPLYIDDVISNDSKKMVEEHIHSCNKCSETLERMHVTLKNQQIIEHEKSAIQVDYMKKLYKYQKIITILGGILSFIVGVMLPVLIFSIPIIIDLTNGGIPEYKIARINLVWYVGFIEMGISGLVFLGLYMLFHYFLKRRK